MKAFNLEFSTSGISGLKKDLKDVAKTLREVDGAGAALTRASRSRGGGGAGGASSFLQGPNQRLAKIREQIKRAVKEGNQDALKDLKILEFRAERSRRIGEKRLGQGETALNAPGLLDLFSELNKLMANIASGNGVGAVRNLAAGFKLLEDTRPGGLNIQQKLTGGSKGGTFSIGGTGGGFNPDASGMFKVSELAEGHAGIAEAAGGAAEAAEGAGAAIAGVGEAAAGAGAGLLALSNPITLVIGVIILLVASFKMAVEGIKAFVNNILETARRNSAVGGAARLTNGNTREIGQLMAMGMSPEQIASSARNLHDKLSSDPMAQIAGNRIGLHAQPGRLFSGADYAKELLQAQKGLAGITNEAERLRIASAFGDDALLNFSKLSKAMQDRAIRDGELAGKVAENTKDADNFNAALSGLGMNWESLKGAIAKPFIKIATAGINAFSDGLYLAAKIANQAADGFNLLGRVISKMPIFRQMSGMFEQIRKVLGLDSKGGSALDRHADAMDRHSRAMEQGLYGGGDMARRAVSHNWHGRFFADGLSKGAMINGAF